MDKLDWLNELNKEEARTEFHRCCGSFKWAAEMASCRPFIERAVLFATAEEEWAKLGPADKLEAFSHHPRLGDVAALKTKFAGEEQSGAKYASEADLKALAEGNVEYEKRFGFVFLLCATGKNASEMLHALNRRITNTRDAEIVNASNEQVKITRLRLEKLLQ